MKSSITSPPLPETNSSPLKIDGWKMKLSFWDAIVSGAMLVQGGYSFTKHNTKEGTSVPKAAPRSSIHFQTANGFARGHNLSNL